MEFKKVRKEHILQGIKDYQEKGLPKEFGPSSTYDIVYEGERYPPKAIMVYANFHAVGKEITAYFKGGQGTDCFNALEREGIEIKYKNDPFVELISNYKTYIAKSKMQDEVYKWELVNKYKGHPDINAEDFTAEIKSIKFGNLIYAMGIAVVNNLARSKPEELRELFRALFNESTPLKERISNFNIDSLNLYRSLGEKLGHHQDERSMATYLTFHDPERYTFYKSAFYKKFCNLLFVKPLGKNEKYVHYLELLQEFIDKYIATDQELIDAVKGYIPEYYDGKNHLLLAQDILYCMLNKNLESSLDIVELIQDFIAQADKGGLKTSSYPKDYNKLKLKVSFGQGVAARIPWIGLYKAPNSISKGIYPVFLYYKEYNKLVLAYGISETEQSDYNWENTEKLQSIEEWHIKEFQKKPDRYGSSFIKGVYDIKEGLDEDKLKSDLEELIAEYEEIDFSRLSNTQEQYETLLNMTSSNSNRNNLNTILYGPPGTGKTYSTVNQALEIIGVDTSQIKRDKAVEIFNSKIKEGQIVFTTFHQNFSYEDFVEGIKPVIESDVSAEKEELKYCIESGIFKKLVDRIKRTDQLNDSVDSDIKIDLSKLDRYINKLSLGNSLNTKDDVIYDYCIQNECIAIGFGEDIDFTGVTTKKEIRERYIENGLDVSGVNDFNVAAIERFILWMEVGQLVFVSEGNKILRAIGEVTGDYYYEKESPIRYNQFRKVKWLHRDLTLPIEEVYGKKFSQQTIYQIESNEKMKSFFSRKRTSHTSNYVLIIDEINRGNVSSIFGELITLIEQDKRQGESEELSVQLPYSKSHFNVPNNLYIIGTMNTADRSVEALDTALRRRFTFKELMPQPTLLKDRQIPGLNLSDLLNTLNSRIENLIDRDHTIGHAFFMNINNIEDLQAVFMDKIIPQLQEYFYGDYGKIGLVLGEGFIEQNDPDENLFADFEYEGSESLVQSSYDLIPAEEIDFEEAINQLMKK